LYLKYAVQSLDDEWTIEAVKKQEELEEIASTRKKNLDFLMIIAAVGFLLWVLFQQ